MTTHTIGLSKKEDCAVKKGVIAEIDYPSGRIVMARDEKKSSYDAEHCLCTKFKTKEEKACSGTGWTTKYQRKSSENAPESETFSEVEKGEDVRESKEGDWNDKMYDCSAHGITPVTLPESDIVITSMGGIHFDFRLPMGSICQRRSGKFHYILTIDLYLSFFLDNMPKRTLSLTSAENHQG